MNARDEAYEATAELARVHMVNAVTYLLGRPPVQGKAAMDRLIREIESQYFPTDNLSALQHFQHGPLVRPRDALVRNLMIVLIKRVILDRLDDQQAGRFFAAISAIREMHRSVAEAALFERLSDLLRRLEDNNLAYAFRLLKHFDDAWQYLQLDVRARLESYVDNLPEDEAVRSLGFVLGFPELQQAAIRRVKTLQDSEVSKLLQNYHGPALLDRAIDLYIESENFNMANRRANGLIQPIISYLRGDQVEFILRGAAANSQITGSFELPHLIRVLREAGKMPAAEFELLLKELNFS